jgi:hypothetical protein
MSRAASPDSKRTGKRTTATAPFRDRRGVLAVFLIGVVGIGAGAVQIGRGRVQRKLAATVAARVVAVGATGVRAEVNGQLVTLRGSVADDPRRQVLLQEVRDVPGVVQVRDKLSVVKRVTRSDPTATGPLLLRAEFVGRFLVLSGSVPVSIAKSDVVDPVVAVLGPGRVEDRLVAANGVDPLLVPPYARAVALAGAVLERGSVVLSGDSLVLLGTVATYDVKQNLITQVAALSRSWRVVDAITARTPLRPIPLDPSVLDSVQAKLDALQVLLDNLVAGVPMTFEANGKLDPLSAVVLDEVARLFSAEEIVEVTVIVRADPVAFTDVDKGLAWSQAQAERIVGELKDRGVQAGRLSAQGVGLEPPRPDEPAVLTRLVVAPPIPPTTLPTDSTTPDSTSDSTVPGKKRKGKKKRAANTSPNTTVAPAKPKKKKAKRPPTSLPSGAPSVTIRF